MSVESWIVGLAVLGAIDSIYTALQQKIKGLFEFCFTLKGERVDCEEILHSKHSRLFKIPNTWLGIILYALLFLIYTNAPVFLSVGADRLYLVGALLSTVGLAIAYYLLYVQAKILQKYCIFCLTSTALLTVITVMAWILV